MLLSQLLQLCLVEALSVCSLKTSIDVDLLIFFFFSMSLLSAAKGHQLIMSVSCPIPQVAISPRSLVSFGWRTGLEMETWAAVLPTAS